jgi:hypothetical protein
MMRFDPVEVANFLRDATSADVQDWARIFAERLGYGENELVRRELKAVHRAEKDLIEKSRKTHAQWLEENRRREARRLAEIERVEAPRRAADAFAAVARAALRGEGQPPAPAPSATAKVAAP